MGKKNRNPGRASNFVRSGCASQSFPNKAIQSVVAREVWPNLWRGQSWGREDMLTHLGTPEYMMPCSAKVRKQD